MTRRDPTAFPTSITSRGLSAPPKRQRVIRSSRAPPSAKKGDGLFDKIGCADLPRRNPDHRSRRNKNQRRHVYDPAALGSITFHPYGDFLMHDVGTGDGILQATREHYGRKVFT